ncbi:hypothetical protein [Leptolyngbya sp. FACHB-261]|uniref:hypothetical protein n=1 Tax=Leptolyngbya sp. FACHB-261 TaxID=2692806 RepID=UPI0016830022|nr:hypothetical protein [Leptolyngbya sp. FACHB-261]MBD2099737.1 hypothetical protein [Leptolyngbya sp. FACHB-261]
MPREVTDQDGITWTCAQAYAGLSSDEESQSAAQVKGEPDLYHVVCTPSGGAQSVRLQLKGNWQESYSDEELLQQIETGRK